MNALVSALETTSVPSEQQCSLVRSILTNTALRSHVTCLCGNYGTNYTPYKNALLSCTLTSCKSGIIPPHNRIKSQRTSKRAHSTVSFTRWRVRRVRFTDLRSTPGSCCLLRFPVETKKKCRFIGLMCAVEPRFHRSHQKRVCNQKVLHQDTW